MPTRTSQSGSELFIVDNSNEDWKVLRYLHDWCQLSSSIDIATGYFEIGSLLSLKGEWQKVDKIRILMGDEVSKRTKATFVAAVRKVAQRLDSSIETEKERNDFLGGGPEIVEALRSGKIECRVYRKDKFHAKAYITHARQEVIGSFALVGSSNFTFPGLTENIELNVQISGTPVRVLQEWYEEHWNAAEDVTPDMLRVIERHIREYTPFEVYAKALQEYFRNREISAGEWELLHSKMFPELDQYQKEGYQALMKIANTYNGAFLCDGVGLGKTFIGMMVIERLVLRERKRVMLLVPKAARKPVWESKLKRYLPQLGGDFSNLVIFNHTDLQREGEFPERLQRMREMADVIIVDEAHHFRNPGIKGTGEKGPSRYWKVSDLAEGKTLFLLTATPVNNKLIDLQHMIELFSRRQSDYFKAAPLGIHSLSGHFRKMEKDLARLTGDVATEDSNLREVSEVEAEQVLASDELFKTLVVQRSRAYVKASQEQHGGNLALFPKREPPAVVAYSVKRTYGRLLEKVERAFSKSAPLFILPMYYPLAYYKGNDGAVDPFVANRQKQVVGLIRVLFLKRFESSAKAFEMSCEQLLLKLLAFMTKNIQSPGEKRVLERWKLQHEDLIGYVQKHQLELFGEESEDEAEDDIVTEEMLENVEELSRDEYRVEDMLSETILDLDQIAEFLEELRKFKSGQDDKLQALVKLLKSDPVLKKNKVIVFSEFMSTARYLKQELLKAGIDGVDEVDSASKRDRGEVIREFAPYYNESSSAELAMEGLKETRVLISTDVLSEGLNLQDATRLINYDLHWNPVRLMQRIGRVDRRMDPQVEKRLLKDHPNQKKMRGTVVYWNFLPPDDLDQLLRLYGKVAHKTLRISKTFGIEGKKLLTPDDDYEALRDFTHSYEGSTTPMEAMHLEYQRLLKDHPDLVERLAALPGKVYSGKAHPTPGTNAIFFCFGLPALDTSIPEDAEVEADRWTLEAGAVRWLLYRLEDEQTIDEASEIIDLIRSGPETPRRVSIPQETLANIREKVEKHLKNTYLRQVQAPAGVRPVLRTWMELN